MNPVLLASASALAEATPEKAAISAPTTSTSGSTFSLPQAGLNAVAERLIGAKVNQQQASAAGHQRDDADPAAMQALLAMLLAQPTQAAPAGVQKQPDGEMLKMLAQVQTTHSGSSLLRQLASAMAQPEKASTPSAEQHTNDLSSLPPKLQTLLASLSEDLPPATPDQQAKLATFSAQDLRAIAPEPASLSTTQQISARVKATQNASPRPVVERKNAGVTVNPALSTQSLLTTAAQGNQPVNPLTDHNIVSTQASSPVMMSTEELGEKLTALLKDRIQFQLGQQQQVSTIRLDPPSLGKLEIAVQLDAGKLMVHIGANQSDVCRSLQQFSENLRQHLTAQNFMEVNVQVSSEGQSQQQKQQSGHQQDEVTSALVLNDEPQFQRNESVLIKV
ncbi:flagellar hook-length control protein FliK [Citrobacter sp. TBCS-15]|uniref:Flagellar hook-length control protein FliK n=1 Tax=Citrobacter werkmanii TaxID=67827 RepID=A0AA37ZC27_9ENTR|nr:MULTISPECIES: flagellar hook-length control protein FliK [Citrobacter]MEC3942831.1 flagellar hook-length control protein FliK [Citrobacter werkmanii]TKT97119.1 flagellar hook-length control protein FliK [Citrobacter sp. TBCS-15]HAT7593043.1 flagellar hook-length control protein FliK [Citrobacter werkmanii]HCL5535134.1 flagellar hook-length control protein FliK [Citrobacter werkmanii]HED1355905.1 flagellar hook-length control protein FliK [Citrobacter werkmanii]